MSVTFDLAKGQANFAPQDAIYRQTDGTAQQPQQQQPNGLTTAGRNWPRLFLIMSAISMGLVMASCILNLITLNIGPSTFFLDAYLFILCFFAFSAEVRQVKCLRGIIYFWIQYLYFLTTYTGRALFYIFLGTLAFGDSILRFIAAAIAIALGVIMFCVNIAVTLPVYTDPEVIREEQEHRAAAGIGQSLFVHSAAAADYRFTSLDTDNNNNNNKSGAADGYRPPGINEGPNAL